MLIDDFIKFEHENHLLSLSFHNVKYWYLIRFDIYNSILKDTEQFNHAHSSVVNESKFKYSISKIKQVFGLLTQDNFNSQINPDLFVMNHPRKIINEDKAYFDMYSIFLQDMEQFSSLVLEDPIENHHYKPSVEQNIYYTDSINVTYNIKRLISKKSYKAEFDKTQPIMDIIKSINETFQTNLDDNYWSNRIVTKIILFEIAYKKFKKLLLQFRPKAIIEVVSYLDTRFAMNVAASEVGIPTIELQHGVMGQRHIAYNFFKNEEPEMFPDYVLTFGDYWRDQTRFPIPINRVKSVGMPYFEDRLKKTVSNSSKSKTILFISQGTIGQELSKFAVKFQKKNTDYKVIYKLHPGEFANWKVKYPWLLNTQIDVVDNSDSDIYHYFGKSNIQIGVYSTALLEGLGYGLKTFILKTNGYNYMEDFIQNDDMVLIDSVANLTEKITDEVSTNHISYYWKQSSVNNISDEINQILKNHNP